MIRTLAPREAEALIAGNDVDVVDVRDPREWATGHVPGARLVPLDALKADPRPRLPRDKVLFVCARGSRSMTAAKLAEREGLTEVYSLEGGTLAWQKAGLPLATPPRPSEDRPSPSVVQVQSAAAERATRATPAAPRGEAEASARSFSACGLPEPGMDALVGANLKELRARRNLSLDALARMTGLSRALLGQIELGRSAPSVSVVWKIARAFDVPFSAFLSAPAADATTVFRRKQAKRLVSPDGRYSSRALFPPGQDGGVEFYELWLAGHAREDAEPHAPGTRENLIVAAGRLELEVAGERFELGKGDAVAFTADVPHAYVNPGSEECWMHLVMTYARQRA